MQGRVEEDGHLVLTVTPVEFALLANSISETLEALGNDPDDFHTRTGSTPEEAESLMREFINFRDAIGWP